ncbi:MAG: hypothetical protein COZ31_02000 [Nitrospirae bacterium CG_4_10_14_3_um_filter_44_29]|nr:MAG: hypothetical protein COZ31_02000 [Nitrospirae bacterium CG_4_10_14_3_um_filter_44_29]
MEVTSSTAQASNAEISEVAIKNFFAVRFGILKIRLTNQAKTPASFNKPTKTIIPTRNRITSKEANFIKFSKSIVCVISSIDVPIKAKLKRKSQKNNVPNMDTENIAIDKA